jgi:hypothetical protein
VLSDHTSMRFVASQCAVQSAMLCYHASNVVNADVTDAVVVDGGCCRFVAGVLKACRQLGVRGRLVHYDVAPRVTVVPTDSSEPLEQVSHSCHNNCYCTVYALCMIYDTARIHADCSCILQQVQYVIQHVICVC